MKTQRLGEVKSITYNLVNGKGPDPMENMDPGTFLDLFLASCETLISLSSINIYWASMCRYEVSDGFGCSSFHLGAQSVVHGSHLGWFCPPGAIWQHLQIFLVVLTGGSGCQWVPVGTGQWCCHTALNAWDSPPPHTHLHSQQLFGLNCQECWGWETLV